MPIVSDAGDEMFRHLPGFPVGKLHRRVFAKISRGANQQAPLTSVQGQFGAANGIDNDTGRVGGILNRQPKLQVHGHITKQLALHADKAHLVVVLPRNIVAGADMDVIV